MKLLSLMVPSKNEFDKSVVKIVQSPGYSHLKNSFSDFIGNIKNTLGQWIMKLLNKLFDNIESASVVSDRLSTIFIIIGILAIILIIIIIIVNINKTLERKRKVKEILGEKIDEKTTPNSLRQRALSFSEAGDLRQAIRYDFIGLLLLMHQHNVVYLDSTKTNEEIYKYLNRNNFSKLDSFKYLIDSFNSVWYGHKEYNKEAYNKWENYLEVIWNEVTKHETKAK